jgi:hypothetical protein
VKKEDFLPLLERRALGNEQVLCVREKNLNELMSLLGKQLIRNVADG